MAPKNWSKLDERYEEVEVAIRNSSSYLWTAQALGVKRDTLKKYLDKIGHPFSITHFRWAANRPKPNEEIFTQTNVLRYATVKKRVLALGHLPNLCSCGQGPMWNGNPLTLEMNHVDGNPYNNSLDNLEILCPNCHSQTETSKGKNCRGTKKSNR